MTEQKVLIEQWYLGDIDELLIDYLMTRNTNENKQNRYGRPKKNLWSGGPSVLIVFYLLNELIFHCYPATLSFTTNNN